MRPKLSIMVTRRHKAVTRLAAAIRRPMPGVLEALEKYFGEALPGGGRVFDLVADGLLRELDWLEAIDRKKYAAEEAAETLRQEVRDGAAALYAQVVSTRDSIVGAFGRAKARKLIQGRVSRNPDLLRGQAEPLVKFLAWQAADECPDAAKVEGFHPEIHHGSRASARPCCGPAGVRRLAGYPGPVPEVNDGEQDRPQQIQVLGIKRTVDEYTLVESVRSVAVCAGCSHRPSSPWRSQSAPRADLSVSSAFLNFERPPVSLQFRALI